jgi:hypothetical protein
VDNESQSADLSAYFNTLFSWSRSESAGKMDKRKLLPAACLVLATGVVLMTQATLVNAAPEECRAKPDLSAQMGEGHWHYRIDRTTQRRCWFLSSGDSRVRHAGSLRRRESLNRSTVEIEDQSKLDGRTSAGPTPVQELFVFSEKSNPAELTALKADGEPETLVPHKVALLSFVQPRAAEQSLARGGNLDLVFFCGAIATALLFAGGVVLAIDRFRLLTRVTPPLLKAKKSQNNAALSQGKNLRKDGGLYETPAYYLDA